MRPTSLWDHIYKIFRFHGWCPNHLQDVQFTAEMCPIHRWDDKSQWKSRDRIYLKCPKDRNDELDKRMQKTVAPVEPVTKHRSNRLASDTLVPYYRCKRPSNAQPSGEVQVAPVTPMVLIWDIGAITMPSLREHVWRASEDCSAPVTTVNH